MKVRKTILEILPVMFLAISAYGANAMAADDHCHGDSCRPEHDRLACYRWSAFPNERLKLNILPHSSLSERGEDSRSARQRAYSVHGKHVGMCGGVSMATSTGTVVVAKDGEHTSGPTGAHLGIITTSVRGNSTGRIETCRPVNFDCTSREDESDPKVWRCFTRNEFDVFHGASMLEKVDPKRDPRCNVFEDGRLAEALDTMEGTGSGLKEAAIAN